MIFFILLEIMKIDNNKERKNRFWATAQLYCENCIAETYCIAAVWLGLYCERVAGKLGLCHNTVHCIVTGKGW